MQISVFIERTGKHLKVNLNSRATVKTLLEKLKLNPVNILVSVNDEICTDKEVLKENDRVELFSVVSGG